MIARRRAGWAAALCAIGGAFGCTLDLSQKHDCRADADCVSGRICVVGRCQPADATDIPNYVFVTSAAVAPVFQTLDAADEICGTTAGAVPLPGHFRAWLSTSTTPARDRLEGARGWIRPDGSPFADTVEDVALGRIFNPLSLDEHGMRTSDFVFTGTGVDGHGDAALDCDDWNGAATGMAIAGTTDGTTGVWTNAATIACSRQARLYCFGVDHVTAVAPPPPRGKLAFLTNDPFTVGGGLAAADDQCRREAAAAQLSGTFRALLAAPGATASSRVQANLGAVWSRLDGVPLDAGGGNDVLDVATMLAPLNVTSQKRYMDAAVLTGAMKPGDPGDDAETCGGWVAGSTATAGRASYMTSWFDSGLAEACASSTADIYCFQSD